MIAAACAGAWLGAGRGGRSPAPQRARWGWDSRCSGAASYHASCSCWTGPRRANALALTGTKLAIGSAGNFILGALMTLGIGLYAPA